MKKILILVIIITGLILSCYIAPESGDGEPTVSFRMPSGNMPKLAPGETATLEILIAGGVSESIEEWTESSEILYYERSISLPDTTFTPYPETEETYTVTLTNVPEGKNLYLMAFYETSNGAVFGFFFTVTPFTVSAGKTTNVTLVSGTDGIILGGFPELDFGSAIPVALNSTYNNSLSLYTYDVYVITVPAGGGDLTIFTDNTTDPTDTVGYLYDSDFNYITDNDDGEVGLDFEILYYVDAGIYYITVEPYNGTEVGPYRLNVNFTPGA